MNPTASPSSDPVPPAPTATPTTPAPASASAPAPAPEASLTAAEVRAAFSGSFPAARLGFSYQASLAIAALTMLVLPLLYVVTVVGAGYLVYLWATLGLFVFSGAVNLWTGLAYLTPLVAGIILVLFMVKPLFAPRAKRIEPFVIDLAQEPALQAYLEEICARVGVALPVRVALDCQVNASASFRRGLWSLGRGDLVLTLGLPLVRGLTAQQLAGVVAHEFGHFAQRTSMAFSYVIRSVSHWFARVVFERDRWDQWLEHHAATSDWRIAAMLHTARGGVWLSRKILHGLMLVGQAISCLLMRQMEYDADYYDIRVGGSDAFAFTSREIRYLSLADSQANRDLDNLWRDRRLVQDYPRLVTLRRAQINAEFAQKFDADVAKEKSGWLHTHPAEPERIARARAAATPGVFPCEWPATRLFTDYAATERAVSANLYRNALGAEITAANLVAAEAVAGTLDLDAAADTAWQQLNRGLVTLDPPFVATLADLTPRADDPIATLREVQAWISAQEKNLRATLEMDNKAYKQLTDALVAKAFLEAGIKVVPTDFGLSESSVAAADSAINSARAARRQHLIALEGLNDKLRAWLGAAVRAAGPEETEVRTLAETFASLSALFAPLPEWLVRIRVLDAFAGNAEKLKAVAEQLRELRAKTHRDAEAWIATAAGVRYPFPHAQEGITVAAFVTLAGQAEPDRPTAHAYLQSTAALYFRLLARIAFLTQPRLAESSAAPVSPPEPPVLAS